MTYGDMTNQLPLVGGVAAIGLLDASAPWWVPLVVQGVSLLLAWISGTRRKRSVRDRVIEDRKFPQRPETISEDSGN